MKRQFPRKPGIAMLLILVVVLDAGRGETREGSAFLTPTPGSVVPVVTALFRVRNDQGILISEAAVSGSRPVRRGRIFVDERGSNNTAAALVNLSSTEAVVRLELRSAAGDLLAVKEKPFAAHENKALFVNRFFPEQVMPGFLGSLTFEAAEGGPGLGAVTLRVARNRHGEPILSTLPVIDLEAASQMADVFPQIGVGEELATELLLLNTSDQSLSGNLAVQLFEEGGGSLERSIRYEIQPQGVFSTEIPQKPITSRGFARMQPEEGSPLPSGIAIFQFRKPDGAVSEAGVPAVTPTRAARVFIDYEDTQTGVAIANPGDSQVRITLHLDGLGERLTTTQDLAPKGHAAFFAHEKFEALQPGDTAILEIQATQPVFLLALKLSFDPMRSKDPILTTLPVADLSSVRLAEAGDRLIFPRVAFGIAFDTRFILLNPSSKDGVNAQLSLVDNAGDPLRPVPGADSEFQYVLEPAQGRQFVPATPQMQSPLARIIFFPQDPELLELTVRMGGRIAFNPVVLDSQGRFIDDVELVVNLLDEIGRIEDGFLHGDQIGFTTLTATAEGIVAAIGLTVSEEEGSLLGPSGGNDTNAGGSVYFAGDDHTIRFVEALDGIVNESIVLAGKSGIEGFEDGSLEEARFYNPSAVHLDKKIERIYVADKLNHSIRLVRIGKETVVTLAGQEMAGFQDGIGLDALFDSPMGVALDRKGALWIVDSANHAVRRLDVNTAQVTTIVGTGQPGSGPQEFNQPQGIAFEVESYDEVQRRADANLDARPPQLLVADTGNNRLQRVFADGSTETVAALTTSSTRIVAPRAVASDAFGIVYVADQDQVKLIFPDGRVVAAAEAGTFRDPTDIAFGVDGELIVSDGEGARKIRYAPPEITTVVEEPDDGGEMMIEVFGLNFAPESRLVITNRLIEGVEVVSARCLRAPMPELPSGVTTVTVFHRGGLVQEELFVPPVSLRALDDGEVATVAGGHSFEGDGGLALVARVRLPTGMELGSRAAIFFADTENHRIRRIDSDTGVINTVAGSGRQEFSGDGSLALVAGLSAPRDIALDGAGNLFIADTLNDRIRRVDADGSISTFAGGGTGGFFVMEGEATEITLVAPQGVALDAPGNLYIADSGTSLIRKVDTNGFLTTVAGGGLDLAEGIPASDSLLDFPTDVVVDADTLYIAECGNQRIRRVVAPENRIETIVAADAVTGADPVIVPDIFCPESITVDKEGVLYVAEPDNDRILRVDLSARTAEPILGPGTQMGNLRILAPLSAGGETLDPELDFPVGIAVDGAGSVYIADSGNDRLLVLAKGDLGGLAGRPKVQDPLPPPNLEAARAELDLPTAMALDPNTQFVYISDAESHRIFKLALEVDPPLIEVIGGNGNAGFKEGTALQSSFRSPQGLALDGFGGLYVADAGNHVIRRIDLAQGGVETVVGCPEQAGTGSAAGPLSSALLGLPRAVAFDLLGRLLIADTNNHRVLRVDFGAEMFETVVGNAILGCTGEDGDPAQSSRLQNPGGLAVDGSGNIFISDTGNSRVRMVDASLRIFNLGVDCNSNVVFNRPQGLWSTPGSRLLVADSDNHLIRELDLLTLGIRRLAGSDTPRGLGGFGGDGDSALEAQMAFPHAIIADDAGNLIFADTNNGRIRLVKQSK